MEFDKPKDALWPLDFLLLLEENAPKPEKYEMRLEAFQESRSNPKLARSEKLEDLAQLVMLGSRYFNPIEQKPVYFYHCDKGTWQPRAEHMIESLCRYIWPGLSPQAITEVIGKIKNYRLGSIAIFDRKRLIEVENGSIDLTTWKLKKHSPDHYSTRAIPVRYDPEKDCPKIKKFLSEVTSEENIRILEEAIGYCLWPEYCYHRAFLLLGPTHAGKGVFHNLLEAFLGSENITNMTLQQLVSRQFGVHSLRGKFANISPDLPSKEIYNTGVFKALTGEDRINADVKYDDAAQFRNTAKLFHQANVIPASKYDDTKAYYIRWIILDFPHSFTNTADEDLINKLTTPDELSGLLNLAITGLRRLRIRGRFEETIDPEAKETAYLMGSDTVKAFIHLKCKITTKAWVIRDSLRSDYEGFCHAQGRTPITSDQFTKTIRKWVPSVEVRTKTIGGQRMKIYVGIDTKEVRLQRGTF